MGQKIHPVAVRLRQNRHFDASWYDDQYQSSFKNQIASQKILESFFKVVAQYIPEFFLGRIFYQQSHQKTIITLFLFHQRGKRDSRRETKRLKYSIRNKLDFALSKNYHAFFGKNVFFNKEIPLKRLADSSYTSSSLFGSTDSLSVNFQVSPKKSTIDTFETPNTKLKSTKKLVAIFSKRYPVETNLTDWVFPVKKAENRLSDELFVNALEQSKFTVNAASILSTGFSGTGKWDLNSTTSSGGLEAAKTSHKLLEKTTYATFLRHKIQSNASKLHKIPSFVKPRISSFSSGESGLMLSDGLQKKLFLAKKDPKAFLEQSQLIHPFIYHLENRLCSFFQKNIYIRPVICKHFKYSAVFLAEEIAQILTQRKHQKKKKMPYRQIKKLIETRSRSIGIRIQCSGRLGGVEMARKFVLKQGQTSLNVFSQKIDFAQRTALTRYGIIGIKVWISFL